MARGMLEPCYKYIEQNCSSFLSLQLPEKYLLAVMALKDSLKAMIVSRYLLLTCIPRKG